ncbi:MAG: hypothetical protein RM021_020445 [Nostoc sp. EkiNYC01]
MHRPATRSQADAILLHRPANTINRLSTYFFSQHPALATRHSSLDFLQKSLFLPYSLRLCAFA